MMNEEQWNSLRQQPVEHVIMALLRNLLEETQRYQYPLPTENFQSWDSIQVIFRGFEVSVQRRNTSSRLQEGGNPWNGNHLKRG